jgi:hypothetical protein
VWCAEQSTRPKREFEEIMPRKTVSSTDLIWLFHERLRESGHFPGLGISLAVVPAPDVGWTVVMSSRQRARHPACAKLLQSIEKQFRETYVLKD